MTETTEKLKNLEPILRAIRYKPGYYLDWDDWGEFITIWWKYSRPDSRNPDVIETGMSGEITLYIPSLDPEDPEPLIRAVFGMTMRLEEHEAREFFMYRDQRPFDPHKRLLE